MKKINLTQIEEGMILSADVFDDAGTLIMSKNDVLTTSLIEKLFALGIKQISINECSNVPLDFDERNGLIEILSNSFKTYALLDTRIFEKIRNQMSSVIVKIIADDNAITSLISLKDIDEYSYNHSIHVGMLSGLIAHLMALSNDEIESSIIAGLFHDIGKLRLDRKILTKVGALTDEEFELVKTHPILAQDFLNQYTFITDEIKKAVLQHHERRDGSGYPDGLNQTDILQIANIVAVADEYDAAVSNKAYREGISPFKASDEIFTDSIDALDPTVSQTLIKFLQKHYVGAKVQLNTGEDGEVILVNKFDPNHPLVRINDTKFYDLSRNSGVKITNAVR